MRQFTQKIELSFFLDVCVKLRFAWNTLLWHIAVATILLDTFSVEQRMRTLQVTKLPNAQNRKGEKK